MTIPIATTKPFVYAPIPDSFDQATQYIIQLEPVEKADYVFVEIEIKPLIVEDNNYLMSKVMP